MKQTVDDIIEPLVSQPQPAAAAPTPSTTPHHVFLVDGSGFIFRAYHARARSGAPPMRTSTGLSTEAIYIFNNMLRRLAKAHRPEYIAAVFESGAPTRHSSRGV